LYCNLSLSGFSLTFENMELDYVDRFNSYGDNMVRLYNFDRHEALKFAELLQLTVVNGGQPLDLSQVDFIQRRNCNLVLRISDTDTGIIRSRGNKFFCDLTLESYRHMIVLLKPFCVKDTTAHQFLYDIDSLTDFLFSPAGTW